MKICGIICEFNPLHNGHLKLIEIAKQNYDYVVCLMSGNFSQRGIPCCMNKYDRSKLAINAGADIVIELPFVYAVNNADEFSYGAIKILNCLGVTDIIFGSECGDTSKLEKLANFKLNESKKFKNILKEKLETGISFQSAYYETIKEVTNDYTLIRLSASPNDILGSSYIKEIKKQNTKIAYHSIKRLDNGYNDTTPYKQYLSASSILELKNQNKDYSSFVPSSTFEFLTTSPIFNNNIYSSLLHYKINNMSSKEMKNIFGIVEGIENLIKKSFQNMEQIETIKDTLSSKRYRLSRINKILLYLLLDVKKRDYAKIKKSTPVTKVLAINKNKKNLISLFLKHENIKLILSNKDYNCLNPEQTLSVLFDQKASDLYSICTNTNLNTDKTVGTLYI